VPNPNKGAFSIKGSLGVTADEEVTATITNMLGQTVYNSTFTAQGGRIDQQVQMSNTASGVYMLTLHSASGNSVFRFVVE
jgi:hypothetical protein